jgi:hypothetical protein
MADGHDKKTRSYNMSDIKEKAITLLKYFLAG